MIHNLVIIFTVILAILLIGIVLIQKSKGGGLSSQFGGANAVMGVRQTNTFLEKATWWLVGLLVLCSILSAYTTPSATTRLRPQQTELPAAPAANQFDTQAPAAEAAPAATEAPAEAN